MTKSVAVAAIAWMLLAPAALAAPSSPSSTLPPAPAASPASIDRPIYRLEFELVETAPGKPATTTAFSMNLPAQSHGSMKIGDNIEFHTTPTNVMREDVGIEVKAEFEMRGASLLLFADSTLKAQAAGASWHRIVMSDYALVDPGKKVLVSAVTQDHTRTELSVTATKL